MAADEDYVHALLAEGWWPDEDGRALLLDGGERLVSWRTLALGGPHHADVMPRARRRR